MKESDALQYVRLLLNGVQKYRSNAREEFHLGEFTTPEGLQFSESLFRDNWPWIFDDRPNGRAHAFMGAMAECVDSNHITAMQFFNFMTILKRFIPEMEAFINVVMTQTGELPVEFPEPDADLITKWEPEHAKGVVHFGIGRENAGRRK